MEETRPIPDPTKLVMTIGVQTWLDQNRDFFPELFARVVKKQFEAQPNTCFDGGNDKYFFSFISREQKFFVAANEISGLTVMLPDEY